MSGLLFCICFDSLLLHYGLIGTQKTYYEEYAHLIFLFISFQITFAWKWRKITWLSITCRVLPCRKWSSRDLEGLAKLMEKFWQSCQVPWWPFISGLISGIYTISLVFVIVRIFSKLHLSKWFPKQIFYLTKCLLRNILEYVKGVHINKQYCI